MSQAEGFQDAKKLYKGRTRVPSASIFAIRATIQERNGVPLRSKDCCSTSDRSFVMSTLEGHSERQPLQARQLSSTSCSSGMSKTLFPRPTPSNTSLSNPRVRISRSTFARVRVDRVSSFDTM